MANCGDSAPLEIQFAQTASTASKLSWDITFPVTQDTDLFTFLLLFLGCGQF
jgi:hypothetical protein